MGKKKTKTKHATVVLDLQSRFNGRQISLNVFPDYIEKGANLVVGVETFLIANGIQW